MRPRRFFPRARGPLVRAVAGATMLAGGLALATPPASARTLEVGPDRTYKLPSEAAAVAIAGDRILIDPGAYADCAVLRADDLVIEGRGPDGRAVMAGKTCLGKAILVVTGDAVTVRNLTLAGARVPDGNGAGIRDESGHLTVAAVRFVNDQDGILTGAAEGATLIVRDSEFLRNGGCLRACAHGIYAGRLALLRIERSRFLETREAHHIKSRAARTEIIDCAIADGPNGTSSYLVDAANGGSLLVRGNTLQKGPRSANHAAAIVIGAEGMSQPTDEITIEDNAFRNDGEARTVFVDNRTPARALLRGNRLTGRIAPLAGNGAVQ